MPPFFFSAIAASVFIFALAILGILVLLCIRLIRWGLSPGDRGRRSEEVRMIQEIYQGLSRMEARVDALETILLDRRRKEHHDEQI